jgi:hypothetical protein
MRTKSQQSSSFLRSIILIALSLIISQAVLSQSVLSGLGVEIGGGYNQLFWQFLVPLPGNVTRYDRTQFTFTPEMRLRYDIQMSENIQCMPYLGYNQIGGKGSPTKIGNKSTIWIDALEIGLLTTYTISDFSFGLGYKANRHLKVTDIVDIPPTPTSNIDVTGSFPAWSSDIGLRMSYRISHYSIAVESWFGISDLGGDGDLSLMSIHQNHFRLLLGYTL